MYEELYRKTISRAKDTNKYRKLPEQKNNFSDYIDFSTNDYLCLSKNSKVLKSALEAGEKYGVGSTGSRLLSGNIEIFDQFERRIAKDKNTESSMIFNSGFQANISVVSTILNHKILKSKPIVFFDKLNHSSLYQAVFLSGAELIRYQHNNMGHLSELLEEYNNSPSPKFIITETVFGMDGDIVPLQDIAYLAKKHNAFLYLDEAHATGLIGKNGYGLSTTIDLSSIDYIAMGTFSKAIGASGGYIACSNYMKEFLVNYCPGFIYSTANSPLSVGAAYQAWKMIKNLNKERKKLNDLASYLREELSNSDFNIGNSQTNIIPIILRSENKTIQTWKKLQEQNFILSCIRPPTVPPNSSRLRIALNITHKKEDLCLLVNTLRNLQNENIFS